ncbi:iron-siderophore ABC transporter substrate-binding protein [Mycobacterium sp.]|uniref:iron-siderophore ABC transporter substrate-binding protein n=1 Tax=Mycobacterium sp. TaxID=1785 RepID=UPI002D306E34|nr:iron-siderophore ABC transporter substrate-binding protein [Mycobacterium sp.]HZA10551.1 iron-siderophore ABC transporter substrate-binding protein [Mycobacterium sp.]
MLSGARPRVAALLPAARVLVAAAAAVVAAALTVVTGCSGGSTPPPSKSVITSTTKIGGAGVLGNERRPDESCAAQPAAPDPGPPTRPVRHAAGETQVPADPQRIVVLAGDELDTLCALGLQSRIVAAALPDDSPTQPWYLGTAVHNLPAVGTRSTPDISGIRAAKPDLILGSQGLTPEAYPALSAIAPTVFTGAPGNMWQDNVRLVGAATGRAGPGNAIVDGFNAQAAKVGADGDAIHFQASIVQFTDNTMRVYGAANFPASVLADVGVDRPAAQRFTDKPYMEIGITDTDLRGATDFAPADGDIVYVSFASPAAKDRAPQVLNSNPWRKLAANRDNRVFVVNNEVWQSGQGVVAARGVVADLRWVNAPIN